MLRAVQEGVFAMRSQDLLRGSAGLLGALKGANCRKSPARVPLEWVSSVGQGVAVDERFSLVGCFDAALKCAI